MSTTRPRQRHLEVPLRRLARIVNGGTPSPNEEYWDGDVEWATPVDLARVDGGNLGSTDRTLTTAGLAEGSRVVPGGSLVLSTRAPIGYVAMVNQPTAFNQGCRGLVPGDRLDSRFLQLTLMARKPLLESLGTGSTFKELSTEALGGVPIPLPPVEEQRRIADFLDDQVARIDEALRLHEAQLTMVEQLRTTGIGQVMTEWHVPLPHEGTRRLATLLERNDGGVWGEDPMSGGGVMVLRSTEIDRFGNWRALDDAALRSLSERDREAGQLRAGDILVTKASGSPDHIGKAAIVTDEVASLSPCFGNFMQRLRVREGLTSPRFVHRFLMSSLAREQFRILSTTSTGLLNLSGGLLSDVRIPDLSLEDQDRVVQEVEKLDTDLTALTRALERGIQVFEERKRALITAAVTGELDVTTATAIGMGKWVPNVGASVEAPATPQASGIGGIG